MDSQGIIESPISDIRDKKKAKRKSGLPWFAWHAWLGYKLSILMFVICLTGTFATVSNEIDWLVNPLLRVEAVGTSFEWQAMVDNFSETYPDAQLIYLDAPLYDNHAAIGYVQTDDGQDLRAIFNQYTGELIGVLPWAASVQRFFRDLHRFLLFPISFGAYLVSFFGFILLASVITALVVYKKWWRGFFKLRVGKGTRIFYGDLHRLLGVWSLWFLLIISLTSVWYFVERAARDTGKRFVEPAQAVNIEIDPGMAQSLEFISLDQAISAARSAIPELRIKFVNLPILAGGNLRPYVISGQATAILVRNNANSVHVNPLNGDVMKFHRAEESSFARRVIESMDPLHFGNFGGLPTKLLYLFFGLLTLLMSATGAWMWLRRNHSLEKRGLRYSYMGWWKHTSIFLLLTGLSWGLYKILTFGALFA